MPQLFISYPREYREVVERLVADLRSSGYDPFFDEQLTGGQSWWDELLSRIEAATAFVPIIGPGYLTSTPCQLESEYAAALGKLFLPISIEPVPPQLFSEAIASAHWAEYDPARPVTVLAVIRAINELRPAPPLPRMMPARPVVPISYMTGLQNEIGSEEEIGRSRQMVLIADLKGRLSGPDKDAALMLLTRIRQRTDVSYQAAVDIDELLARHSPQQAPRTDAAQPPPEPARQEPPPVEPQAAQVDPAPPQPARPEPPPVEPQHAHADPPPSQPEPARWGQPGQRTGAQTHGPGDQAAQPGWPPSPPAGTLPTTKPNNYYLWTILSCVLCCIPLGIVGIVYSSRVDSFWAKGQVAEAVDASNKAKMWAILSAVCGFLVVLFIIGLGA